MQLAQKHVQLLAIVNTGMKFSVNRSRRKLYYQQHHCQWAGQRSRYIDWLRAGRSGDRIPVGARFSAPVQTGPGAHTASCTKGTGSFLGVKSGGGVTLTPHPLLVPWSRKGRPIPLLSLWAVRPVQSLSACTRVHFTFTFFFYHYQLPKLLTVFSSQFCFALFVTHSALQALSSGHQ